MDIKKIIREEIENWGWLDDTTPEMGFLSTVINQSTVRVWSDLNFDNIFFIPNDGKNIVVVSTNFEYTMWDGEATHEELVSHFLEHSHVEFYSDMDDVSSNFYGEQMDLDLTLDEQIDELIDMSKLEASFSRWRNSLTIKKMDLYYDPASRRFHESVKKAMPNIHSVLYVKAGM